MSTNGETTATANITNDGNTTQLDTTIDNINKRLTSSIKNKVDVNKIKGNIKANNKSSIKNRANIDLNDTDLDNLGNHEEQIELKLSNEPLLKLLFKPIKRVGKLVKNQDWVGELSDIKTFSSPSNFRKPTNTQETQRRIKGNIVKYRKKYIVVSGILSFLILFNLIIHSPFLILCLIASTIAYFYIQTREQIKIGKFVLKGDNKLIALGGVSSFVVLLYAGSTLIYLSVLCVSVIMLHAMFHAGNTHEALKNFDHDNLNV